MINSTNTVNIDGEIFEKLDVRKTFSIDENDSFSRWVLRPIAILAAIGIGVAAFIASAMLIMVSLALLPILAVAVWAMRTKLERDLKRSVVESEAVVVSEHHSGSDSHAGS